MKLALSMTPCTPCPGLGVAMSPLEVDHLGALSAIFGRQIAVRCRGQLTQNEFCVWAGMFGLCTARAFPNLACRPSWHAMHQ